VEAISADDILPIICMSRVCKIMYRHFAKFTGIKVQISQKVSLLLLICTIYDYTNRIYNIIYHLLFYAYVQNMAFILLQHAPGWKHVHPAGYNTTKFIF